ncbi:phasin family protein [Pseudoduganella lutea]|uniref:Phasin family protein n=1 Tax=Pseudoduganella lutea TaxID=321985 RepID=A0A4P6KZJ7_9BURK|nr:phasin family protein [Pseudoduganella lutea]QBE64669.1 phasin family protein [Pseudoduganella lutea]
MFPYSQAVNPSLRSHLESQAAFFNDFSNSLSTAFQNIYSANLKLGQAMLEESATVGRRLLTTRDTAEALQVVASAAQPASNKYRAYQQHLSRLAADAQVDFSRVTQQHAQHTSRTARDLVEEVARNAAEQTENNLRQQREAVEKAGQSFRFGATQDDNDSADSVAGARDKSKGNGASVQVDAQAGGASIHGSAQGPITNAAHEQSNKKSG